MQNQTPNYRPPPPQPLNHQIQGSHPGKQGGPQGGPHHHRTKAMRGPQNNRAMRYSTQNLQMYPANLVQYMHIQAAGQPRIPTYSQTGPVTAQHTTVQQPGQTTHVLHTPHQQYYQLTPQYITMNNGTTQGLTHPQAAYYLQGPGGAPVACQVHTGLQLGTSQMSYSAQQPVHNSQIGQSGVNPQRVHGLTQQQQAVQQQQQQQQHQSQVQAIPQQHYRHPVDQSNVGQPYRGSSNKGGPQRGNVVGHTGGSGPAKDIPPPIAVRKKKILAIIDPTSGKNVIDAPEEPTGPSATAETVKEDDKSKSETPEVSVATPKMSGVVSGIGGSSGTGDPSSTKDSTPSQTEATDYSSSKTKVIKIEFFNKILQANDATPTTTTSSPPATTTTSVVDENVKQLVISEVEPQGTAVEDGDSVDKSTVDSLSELTVTTMNSEKVHDEAEEDTVKEGSQVSLSDSHDVSTVSISPTPIEAYCNQNMTSQQGSTVDDTNELNPAQNLADDPKESRSEELEDGEISTSDKDNDEKGKAPKEEANASKRIRKYDRDLLLKIKKFPASHRPRNDLKIVDEIRAIGETRETGVRTFHDYSHYPFCPKPLGNYHAATFPRRRNYDPPPSSTPPLRQPRVIELKTKVELNKAENAWKPTSRGGDSDESPEEKLIRAIVKQTRGILNKLTPENFDRLCENFLKLELDDQNDRISAVIDVVFEKAIDEPNFSPTYARMVHHVCKNSQETAKKFRKEILDKCQQEFQKTNNDEDEIKDKEAEISNAPEDKKEQLELELEEKRTQSRRRYLGNIRFIGELYKLQILTPKIMVDCVNLLINNQDEEGYECLCKLLTTVGQKLDNQLKELEQRIRQAKASNQQLPKFMPNRLFMDKTFVRLNQLSRDTAKLSSRIRFALLDVIELRENGWKPRRNNNAPKTIDEVHREAVRQDEEEKRQINALPDPMMSARHFSPQPSQRPQSQQQRMGNDWNIVQTHKSNRFLEMSKAKPIEPILGGSPRLAPSMGAYGGGQPQSSKRLQNQQQQQQNPMSSSFGGQQSHNGHRSQQQQQMPNRSSPSMKSSSQPSSRFNMLPRQASPPASQPPPPHPPPPQHPQQQPSNIPDVLNLEPPSPKVNETVKNIFLEYCSVKKYEDTIHWVQERFPGDKVTTFVDCLARQVGEMSKPELQCGAGQLIKMLIKHKLIRRDLVLRVLTKGLIPDIPDIQVDCPKVTTYVAVFILEVFGDEANFNWLLELTRPLKEEEETMADLIRVTLIQLQLKKTEEHVKSLWKMTDERDSISDDCLPWPKEESITSLVNKIIPVLRKHKMEDVVKIYHENTWDIREVEVCTATLLATCEVSFVNESWEIPVLEKCLALFSNKSTPVPNVWKHAKEFIKNKKGTSDDEEILWSRLQKLNLVSKKHHC